MKTLLALFPQNTSINFLGLKAIAASLSLALVGISIAGWLVFGLNTGIDFQGGFIIEAQARSERADLETLRRDIGELGLGDFNLQEFGSPRDILIRVQSQGENAEAQTSSETSSLAENDAAALGAANRQAIQRVTRAISSDYTIRRTEFVGAVVSDELRRNAFFAVLAALGSILVYIWFRFEFPFAIAAIFALAHDVVTTVGVFALTRFEFNLATVAALLTIAGYSINDTVVIFDRIRENLKKHSSWPNEKLINYSLNQTLSRTLMTSLTTLIALFAIYVFGGAVLGGFALAMIWGVLIGTYSSIYVASALLTRFNLRPDDDDSKRPQYEKNSAA
ncbi:MAG: protein translocase subunit SecF [Proteobacteria bacterium]|nr:protein translocase subunit SecF [Pseudomonadota bacterium]